MKTILIVLISVAFTVIVMQNTDEVMFKILWAEVLVSKLWMMLGVCLFGFVLGLIVARPRSKAPIVNVEEPSRNVPLEINNIDDEDYIYPDKKQGLSDEDR